MSVRDDIKLAIKILQHARRTRFLHKALRCSIVEVCERIKKGIQCEAIGNELEAAVCQFRNPTKYWLGADDIKAITQSLRKVLALPLPS